MARFFFSHSVDSEQQPWHVCLGKSIPYSRGGSTNQERKARRFTVKTYLREVTYSNMKAQSAEPDSGPSWREHACMNKERDVKRRHRTPSAEKWFSPSGARARFAVAPCNRKVMSQSRRYVWFRAHQPSDHTGNLSIFHLSTYSIYCGRKWRALHAVLVG